MTDFVKIIGVNDECYDTKTFEFRMDAKAYPGQFVMVWVPGMEEIPMSLSKTGRIKSITVKKIGPDTERLHQLTIGDTLRVRGPYGNGYHIERNKDYLVVGGGVGAASILPAVKESRGDVIIGARTKDDIILADRAMKYADEIWFSTDDGSFGFHGNAVQLMKEKCAQKEYDCILACGPEVMLFFLHKACTELGIPCQLSLERHMKCGAGVCGCCVMDGLCVCKDGPVFTGEQISGMDDFGNAKRDTSGRKVNLRRSYAGPREPHLGNPWEHDRECPPQPLQRSGCEDRRGRGRGFRRRSAETLSVAHRRGHGGLLEECPPHHAEDHG